MPEIDPAALQNQAGDLHRLANDLFRADLPIDIYAHAVEAKALSGIAVFYFEMNQPFDAICALALAEREMRRALLALVGDDIRRGRKVAAAARQGHEAVHGTSEEKDARWKTFIADYESARSAGMSATDAVDHVAEKHRVHTRTIWRVLTRLQENRARIKIPKLH